MKLCFSTLGCAENTLEASLTLARSHGFDAIELRGIGGVMNNSDIYDLSYEGATETKKLFNSLGVRPIVLGTSCSFHNAEKYEKSIPEGKAAILIAERFGIPYIRVFGNLITDDREACIEQVISGIKELCDFADGKGVTVILEVHGDFNTVEALAPIIDRLEDNKCFGILWDVAHSHRAYGENWLPFYEFIRPYIKHVHIKDANEKALTQIGEGDIPIIQIGEKLLSDGYDGYFSLEWESKWHPELGNIEPALDCFGEIMKKCRQS